ncbi:MAG TPA: hypothetical protein PK537_08170 [Candidatus Limiplasma sp.]|nr:hypothetical protein [Candidatus Limiplasma sp.]
MKKKLLLIVLSLAILTSLTAGTLAVYTKTLGDTEKIEAKRFAFSVSGDVKGDSTAIKLAPTEEMEYDFIIANSENGGPNAEVPLKYNVTLDISTALAGMPGLKATVYDGKAVVGTTGENGILKYDTSSKADEAFAKTYTVIVKWEDTDDQGQTKAGKDAVQYNTGLSLTVIAEQDTTTNTKAD